MGIEVKTPLVSVIVTSYNYAKFIRDALESVSAQTYRPLECIVVDDCSTDNSLEIIDQTIRELQEKNNGIAYSRVSTKKNSGQLAAFLLGISQAKGVFINFLDADDILFPDFISVHVQVHLENLVALTTSEPFEIDSDGQVHSFHSNSGNLYDRLKIKRNIRPVRPFEIWRQNLLHCGAADDFAASEKLILASGNFKWNTWCWYPTSSALFRKSALSYLCKADPEQWRICADWLLFSYANIIGNTSCLIPFQLSAYRRHGGNGFSLDAVIGSFRYVSREKRQMSDEFQYRRLPLSLLQIFSSLREQFPEKSVEFMRTVIYSAGPRFLLRHWNEVFSFYHVPSFGHRAVIFLKTIIRHRQFNRKWKF